jgi:hypothetical protein
VIMVTDTGFLALGHKPVAVGFQKVLTHSEGSFAVTLCHSSSAPGLILYISQLRTLPTACPLCLTNLLVFCYSAQVLVRNRQPDHLDGSGSSCGSLGVPSLLHRLQESDSLKS